MANQTKRERIESRVFLIAEYFQRDLEGGDIISNHDFVGCTIIGPAVLLVTDEQSFKDNRFEAGAPEHILWEILPSRGRVIGAIGLSNTSFERCMFRRIGIAGPPKFIRKLRADLVRSSGVD